MAVLSSSDNAGPATVFEETLRIVRHELGDVGLVADHLAALGEPIEVRQPNTGDSPPEPRFRGRAHRVWLSSETGPPLSLILWWAVQGESVTAEARLRPDERVAHGWATLDCQAEHG